ncbi:hypothetical protein HFP89_00605 [Wenzhouxiangella sp. XN79A]|uniref:hypothetical protein n=1 Tax=Wenzhouxiangella sp. XN79A TaxID=2724193 RepID=UPI00144AAB5F|nr:hypothetical protein [Wenzhouxiangella sp. XN79A]NKI33664.1 hypothetical protein [Wenzhouxiangella sp. XN79A]
MKHPMLASVAIAMLLASTAGAIEPTAVTVLAEHRDFVDEAESADFTHAPMRYEGLPSEVRLAMDRAVAPISNEAELVEYIANTDPRNNPLNLLSEGALKVFLGTLSFGPEGLASYNSAVLEEELTPTESYAVPELFGFQESVSALENHTARTDIDRMIKWFGSCQEKNGAKCEGNGYVNGFCLGQGTCAHDDNFTCHPPSCG